MRTSDAIELFEYLYWTRDVILRAAAELSDDEFTSTETHHESRSPGDLGA